MHVELMGQRFYIMQRKHKYWYGVYQCECGKYIIRKIKDVNESTSCGCKFKYCTHRQWNSPAYKSWAAMMVRCNNEQDKHYPMYGGRGITICESWLKFENFYKDMGDRPKGLSIDRINNDNGYDKENCRWATSKEQCRNRSNNRYLTINGITKTMAEWSDHEDAVEYKLIKSRMNNNWSDEDKVFCKFKTNYGRKSLTIDGMTKTIKQWAETDGAQTYNLIYERVRLAWDPKSAVFQEKQIRGYK